MEGKINKCLLPKSSLHIWQGDNVIKLLIILSFGFVRFWTRIFLSRGAFRVQNVHGIPIWQVWNKQGITIFVTKLNLLKDVMLFHITV